MKVLKRILIILVLLVFISFSGIFFVYSGFGKRNDEIKSVAHRGYSIMAPENTLPAYRLAKEKGFDYGECDVAFTKDGVAVLLHDSSIDRTSNGKGKISDFTYNELLQYDFGSWFSEDYKGLKIPTFEEFLMLCKEISLKPYIELKASNSYTKEQITSLVHMVEAKGMSEISTWISFNYDYLLYVKEADETARLGYLSTKFSDEVIEKVISLRTGKNEVSLNLEFKQSFSWRIEKCKKENIPVEIWTVNDEIFISLINPYISGVTSDCLVADKIV